MKLTLFLLPVFALLLPKVQAEAPKPKNILFIYVEDLGYYTSERAAREPNTQIAGLKTPNLDALAASSLVFNRAFCGQSVCSPSKSAIYSGLLPHTNGIWKNCHNTHPKLGGPEKWTPLPDPLTPQNDPTYLAAGGMHEDIPTLIQALKAKGVYCAFSEKLHQQPARNFPYDAFVKVDDLNGVIKGAAGRPWLFWCNPDTTHAPFWRHINEKLSNPKDSNGIPNDVNPQTIKMLPWLPDTPAARIDISQYYSCIRSIDTFVGEILKTLEASGQAGNTLVVFTGDHGIPVQRGKTSIYPAGTQVPVFIKGPGVKTGRVLNTPISQLDFNPTFLEVFGLKAQPGCHGQSLWSILSGKRDEQANRRSVMTETNNSFASAPKEVGETAARAVCDGRYYYIANLIQDTFKGPAEKALFIGSGNGEYGDPGAQYGINLHDDSIRQKDTQPLPYELLRQLCMSDAPKEELYDLDADPWAVKNLINDPAQAQTVTRLRKEMTLWRTITKDPDVHPSTIPRRTKK